jgi:hypothetical protein
VTLFEVTILFSVSGREVDLSEKKMEEPWSTTERLHRFTTENITVEATTAVRIPKLKFST